MPLLKKQNKDKVDNVCIEYTWITIPVSKDAKQTYLVNKDVAEYITLLENKIDDELPILNVKQ